MNGSVSQLASETELSSTSCTLCKLLYAKPFAYLQTSRWKITPAKFQSGKTLARQQTQPLRISGSIRNTISKPSATLYNQKFSRLFSLPTELVEPIFAFLTDEGSHTALDADVFCVLHSRLVPRNISQIFLALACKWLASIAVSLHVQVPSKSSVAHSSLIRRSPQFSEWIGLARLRQLRYCDRCEMWHSKDQWLAEFVKTQISFDHKALIERRDICCEKRILLQLKAPTAVMKQCRGTRRAWLDANSKELVGEDVLRLEGSREKRRKRSIREAEMKNIEVDLVLLSMFRILSI
ncbi:MAG: hypothetical protein Q9227_004886 [Pyrenula ochraceoflavens]